MSNYPPGASAELDRRAAAEEAWEAYADLYLEKAILAIVNEAMESADEQLGPLNDYDRKRVRELYEYIAEHWDEDRLLYRAAAARAIPSFDDWCNPEPDPDRRRDEREDR